MLNFESNDDSTRELTLRYANGAGHIIETNNMTRNEEISEKLPFNQRNSESMIIKWMTGQYEMFSHLRNMLIFKELVCNW